MRTNALRHFIFLMFLFQFVSVSAQTPISVEDSVKRLASDPNFIDITNFKGITIDLKYATSDNFTGTNLYGNFKKAYLHKIAAEKLKKAVDLLQTGHPGYKFIVFDALRPRSVQWKLWDRVKGTAQQKFVANPKMGSNHNYGFAVDISLLDENGRLLDMGAPFDGFTPLSEPQLEGKLLKEGRLSQKQVDNRLILRHVMKGAGFIQLPHEWWHYDALNSKDIRGKMEIVE